MAATVMSPGDGGQWSQLRNQRSQQASEHSGEFRREKKRSPNRIKAKPANPAVISSILDSLDTLTLASTNTPPEDRSYYSESISERSQPDSADSPLRSIQAAHTPVSIEHGFADNPIHMDNDHDGTSDAALPPTIRTSRPASGLSHYNAPRTPSFTGTNPLPLARTPSLRSRRSSYSSLKASRERPGYSKNKLSAESWVKQNSLSHESIEIVHTNRSRSEKSVRRMGSHSSLRQKGTRIELVPEVDDAAEAPVVSRAEQIIAKATTPPLSTSKRRLYLTDSGSTEEHLNDSLGLLDEPSAADDYLSVPTTNAEGDESPSAHSSLHRSMIVDSIPTRTSSLRLSHSGSPVRGKKKERKSKRQVEKAEKMEKRAPDSSDANAVEGLATESKVDSVMGTTSKTIPESSWADLGEEDETVKRIRELQEKRKSRFMESQRAVSPEIAHSPANQTHVAITSGSGGMTVNRSDEEHNNKRAVAPRPGPDRASTEPPVKAHKVLGINGTYESTTKVHLIGGPSSMNDVSRRRHLSLDEKKMQIRPLTIDSTSPTPPLSLDYSYADAVDALHGAEREMKKNTSDRKAQQRQASTSISERLPEISAQYPGTQLNLVPEISSTTTQPPPHTPKSVRRKQQDRWTHYHPDLPLNFERKKSRRKSTSDARHTQSPDVEPEPPVPRRDSLEDAVTDYLHHGRLSRRIKHPTTGRVISFSEVGDRSGAAVFVCVGMGLTRYVTAFYDELATTLRLRLITVDRPGVGGSEPYSSTDRSGPLKWPDDVLTICQYLGISRFSMVAHSAGAIYALATALVLPHLVHGKIHLLAPWIPPSQLEAVSHSTSTTTPAGALPRSQRILRVLPTTFLKAANSSFMTATSASLKPATKRSKSGSHAVGASPSHGRERPATRDGAPANAAEINRRESLMLMDQFMPDLNPMENFPIPAKEQSDTGTSVETRSSLLMAATAGPMDPSFEFASSALNAAEHTEKERKTEYTTRLTQRTWELAVRDSNPATDLLVCLERHADVGFRYTDVSREVVVTHGSEDKRVPLANVKWLAEQMNRRAAVHNTNGGSMPHSREGWSDPDVKGGCELRVLQGEGHGLMASPTIMGEVLTEIAGYWRMR